MSATDALPPLIPLSQKPVRIIKARPPNRPPPHLPPKPPQKPPPCPQHAPTPPAAQPEPAAEPTTSGVCVKKIAGLFQKDPGAGDDPQPRLPPKPPALLPREDQEDSPGANLMPDVDPEEEQSGAPPLPPKVFQDPDERSSKMAMCPPRPACPSRCCCACHQQRPGMVLVWLPESSVVSPGLLVNEASDSSDDSGVFQRVLSVNEDEDEDGGKWSSWHLKDKMNVGTCYPVRRRSLKHAERSRQHAADGGDKARDSVVLTSYKSTAEDSFNGDLPSSACEAENTQKVGSASNAPEIPKHGPPSHRRTKAAGIVDVEPTGSSMANGPETSLSKNAKSKSISFSDEVSTMAAYQSDSAQSNGDPNSDPVTLRGEAETRSKIRKPARRSKVPPLSMVEDPEPPTLPPKVPSKPPERSSAPATTCTTSVSEKGVIKKVFASVDVSPDRFMTRIPTVKSPKSIDWESHLRDEPLYQTYRQSVINKEIRRQTVARNSSFTSYDSSQESPLSSGGSPKQGRRSAAPHNTLWQEIAICDGERCPGQYEQR
ncbi:unnamed protein product [Ranitomeya imitator]|uniref:Uncharacterized protein n=1 Tax=Ranitomeya imitator TaxID=111125 RepID=A0ABN9L144_9NEOB|nr:unnamed protein product [Ranitomeya imitator]